MTHFKLKLYRGGSDKSQRLIYLNQQWIESAPGDPDNSSLESFMHVQKKQRLDVQMILQILMILRSSQPSRAVPNPLFSTEPLRAYERACERPRLHY